MAWKLELWKDGNHRFVKRVQGRFFKILRWEQAPFKIETWKDGIERQVFRNQGRFVRILKFEMPKVSMEEQEEFELEEIEEKIEVLQLYRYTVGTNFSDKNIPVSFSGYFFKIGEEFDYSDERKCFLIFFEEMFKILYPLKNYNYSDFVSGWDTAVREEHNAEIEDLEAENRTFRVEWNRKGIPQNGVVGTW